MGRGYVGDDQGDGRRGIGGNGRLDAGDGGLDVEFAPHAPRIEGVGDAAGLVDPLLGEGIRYAVWSALIATQSILDEDMAAYTCQVHKEIGMHLNMARLWAWLFYRYPRASFELGVRNPYLTPDMIRMFNGNLTYGSMLLRIPKYVWGLLHRLEV